MCSFLCDHLATPPNHSCAWFCIGLNLATHAMLKKQTNQTIIFMSERTHIPRRPCFHQSLLCPYPFLCTHHASTLVPDSVGLKQTNKCKNYHNMSEPTHVPRHSCFHQSLVLFLSFVPTLLQRPSTLVPDSVVVRSIPTSLETLVVFIKVLSFPLYPPCYTAHTPLCLILYWFEIYPHP